VASAIVIGVGPGIGAAVARRFEREGLVVSTIARSNGATQQADVTDEEALKTVLDALIERHGIPDVLVYNAAHIQSDRFGALDAAAHLDAYAVNVVGAMTAVAHVAPRMAARGSGTVLLTGGMPRAIPEATSLSVTKAALRALTELLDREYGPQGVHVATVTVAGTVAPGTAYDPDDIADRYWRLHTQPAGTWEREVVHG
jgi:NAD(P)-dependent dehydrogenase (short-subunit alcohol dehydrogenase family)